MRLALGQAVQQMGFCTGFKITETSSCFYKYAIKKRQIGEGKEQEKQTEIESFGGLSGKQ